jgi:hypothetical protein
VGLDGRVGLCAGPGVSRGFYLEDGIREVGESGGSAQRLAKPIFHINYDNKNPILLHQQIIRRQHPHRTPTRSTLLP